MPQPPRPVEVEKTDVRKGNVTTLFMRFLRIDHVDQPLARNVGMILVMVHIDDRALVARQQMHRIHGVLQFEIDILIRKPHNAILLLGQPPWSVSRPTSVRIHRGAKRGKSHIIRQRNEIRIPLGVFRSTGRAIPRRDRLLKRLERRILLLLHGQRACQIVEPDRRFDAQTNRLAYGTFELRITFLWLFTAPVLEPVDLLKLLSVIRHLPH